MGSGEAAVSQEPTPVDCGLTPLRVSFRKDEYLSGGNVIPKSGHADEVNCFCLKTKSGSTRWCAIGQILRRLGMPDETMLNITYLEALPHGSIPERLFRVFRTRPGRLALTRVTDINDSTCITTDAERIRQINEQLAPFNIELELT